VQTEDKTKKMLYFFVEVKHNLIFFISEKWVIFTKKTRNILKICQKITPFYMKKEKKCLFIEFFVYLCIQLIKAE
jgi:hypothetical protein